ncbi:MAG: molecular chaperone HtpG [Oscillospiraceae bacterium]|nr:molecular chaperone HtpG [Oscillospiraceae bacterium]
MAMKEFKAESKRLLDLMINSIYTHREIFLRELISNSSDAMDKLYFKSLTDDKLSLSKGDLRIFISTDKEKRLLTIQDNGIGMTKEELEDNLGTIAQSGSREFKSENETGEDVNIIGQFGVGFYSAFMVSDNVTVISRSYGSEQAYRWESSGADGYEINPCEKEDLGTTVILKIKESTGEHNYDEFLEQYRIQSIVKKYSDYIRYPIVMKMERSKLKEGTGVDGKDPEYDTHIEEETLNSMIPLWRKAKSEAGEDELNNFYKEKFMDYENPLKSILSKTEGAATYNALLYIPAKAPYNYYSKDYEKGLQLYSSGVLIMDKCSDLLPDHFSFVKGLVDSEDLSLNISREMLQHDRQLKIIAKSIEKKIKSELDKMLVSEREEYEKFFSVFGLQLKFGLYNNYGMDKETVQDLIMFVSSLDNKLVTLKEYVSRMKDEQKFIYYAAGESVSRIEHLPQTELVKDKGFEILYMTDDIDEFALQMIREYDGKQFKSVSAGDLDLDTDEEKEDLKKQNEDNKELFELMKESLDGKVAGIRLSGRLKSHPVCLSSEGHISLEMEKVLSKMPGSGDVKAERVLEINSAHPIFTTLKTLHDKDKDKLKTYTQLLYSQALLIEGISIEDPVAFSNAVCGLMV